MIEYKIHDNDAIPFIVSVNDKKVEVFKMKYLDNFNYTQTKTF